MSTTVVLVLLPSSREHTGEDCHTHVHTVLHLPVVTIVITVMVTIVIMYTKCSETFQLCNIIENVVEKNVALTCLSGT